MKTNTNIDADFTEFKPDEHLEAIRQEHEPFLTQLEALAVMAIATNDWDAFYQHLIDFQNEDDPTIRALKPKIEEMAALFAQADAICRQPYYQEQASTEDLSRPGAGLLQTEQSERITNIMPEPILTPTQQALMGFLDRLASTDRVSADLLAEGTNLLDAAVEEHRQGADQIHNAGKALSLAQKEAHHRE